MGMVFNMAGGPPLPLLTSPGAAGDLRAGTQLIDNNGDVLTGTLPEVEQATPTISVSDGGLITATVEQAGGIVPAGNKSATDQLPTQAAKTVTPGTAQQTAVPAGVYTTGAITVQGDANLVPENIAEGVSIFGVTGTLAGGGTDWLEVPLSSAPQTRAGGGGTTVYATIEFSDTPYMVFLMRRKTSDGQEDPTSTTVIYNNASAYISANTTFLNVLNINVADNKWQLTLNIDSGFELFSLTSCYAFAIFNGPNS